MKHKKAKKKPSIGRELLTIVGTALILSILVRTFLVQAFYVPSASMEDTLQENDRIIVSKISTRFTGIDRGNVIVFHDPGGWLGEGFPNPYDTPVGRVLQAIGIVPANSGNDLVKRVIGVANDKIECCDAQGRITVNGVVIDESYTKDGVTSDQVTFSVLVPEGNVFVMGDNRGNSEDSRFHLDKNNGMIPVEEIIGRVAMRIWPVGRIGGIEN
ncbi:MAG: signal peptidase [Actinomycetota bacterium]